MGNYVPQGNLLQVNQTNTLIWRGIGSYTSPSPLSVISFLWCQGITFGCVLCSPPYTLELAQNPTCLGSFSALSFPSIHEANLLIQALIIVAEMQDNLLPSGHDRSNLAPWNPFKMQMQKSSFWITASSTFRLFHPASSPFFYYIKHKLLAFILRVVLRWWQLIQMSYTST